PEVRASRPITTGPSSSSRANAAAKRASTGGVSDSPTMPRTPATLIMRPLVFMGGGLRYATRRDGTKPSAPCVLPSRPGPRRLHAHFFEAHGEEIAARATRAAGLLDGCLHPGPLGLSPRSAAQSRADERSLPASAAPPRERRRASEPAEVSLDAKRSHADGLLAVEGPDVP